MRNTLIIVCLFWMLGLYASSPEKLLIEADSLYKAGDYNNAWELYQSLEGEGLQSASLYYNMGNTQFKRFKLAEAILYYEKALKSNPKDEDIAFNLSLAREQQVDNIEEIPGSIGDKLKYNFASLWSSQVWGFLSVISLGIGLLLFILLLGKISPWRQSIIGIIASISLALFTLASAWWVQQVEQETHAILMSANAYVKSAPLENSEDAFIIHQGLKVKILEHYKGWTKIRLADGKVGWLRENDLAEI